MSDTNPMSAHSCVCSDSKLSTAANIIGIITFVYAVAAGVVLYLQRGADLFHQSMREIEKEVKADIDFMLDLANDYWKLCDHPGQSSSKGELVCDPEGHRLDDELKTSIELAWMMSQQTIQESLERLRTGVNPTLLHRVTMMFQYIFHQKKRILGGQESRAQLGAELKDSCNRIERLWVHNHVTDVSNPDAHCDYRQIGRQSKVMEKDSWSQQRRELQDIKEALRDLRSSSFIPSDGVGPAVSKSNIERSQTG